MITMERKALSASCTPTRIPSSPKVKYPVQGRRGGSMRVTGSHAKPKLIKIPSEGNIDMKAVFAKCVADRQCNVAAEEGDNFKPSSFDPRLISLASKDDFELSNDQISASSSNSSSWSLSERGHSLPCSESEIVGSRTLSPERPLSLVPMLHREFELNHCSSVPAFPVSQGKEGQSSTDEELSRCSLRNSTDNLSQSCASNASVLQPITTRQARQRSFLIGSIGSHGALLGEAEMMRYFPDKRIHVLVGTWNMNGQGPPENMDDFLLPDDVKYVPDIYAIGVQEGMLDWREWEVSLQTTIGTSHILFHSVALGVLHLAVFIRRDLIWFCSVPEDSVYNTRSGSMVKTKGAVAIAFLFFGTSFLFINCHLTAHEKKLKDRVADYEKIRKMLDLPKQIPLKPQYISKDVTARFDCVFWCGDFNFRLVRDRDAVLSFIHDTNAMPSRSFGNLLKYDQLRKAMKDGSAFCGFQEGKIHFAPSYKFDKGTNAYDTVKNRVPSYTDRILYRCKKKGTVECLQYNSVSRISISDHKPVYGTFEVKVKPGRDNIPLAAGLFKRDVYLEAIKRRSLAMESGRPRRGSAVCSIM